MKQTLKINSGSLRILGQVNQSRCQTVSGFNIGADMKDAFGYELDDDEPQYEVYTFNENTGSETIHFFYTQEEANKFMKQQADHKMAH